MRYEKARYVASTSYATKIDAYVQQLDPLKKDELGGTNGVASSSLMPVVITHRRSDPTFGADADAASVPKKKNDGRTPLLGKTGGEEVRLLGLPTPENTRGGGGDGDLVWWDVRNVRRSIRVVPNLMWRRVVKSCILAAKVVSVFFYLFFRISES